MSTAFDTRELRNILGLFATGVAVVTAVDPGGRPVGLTVNSLTSVSLDPPLLLWCLASKSANLPAFALGAPFHVHILADGQTSLALHFARGGREKFEVDPHWTREPAPPPIEGAIARMTCTVDALHAAGDHVVIVGRIDAAERKGACVSRRPLRQVSLGDGGR
jgi:flavin reductase (DIM6/NTAB) family NADH-FMN oxidoreductase RutF